MMKFNAKTGLAALAATFLSAGCATTATLVEHHNLNAQTKMSQSVFMDPLAPADQVVFLQIRNTTDKPDFDISGELASAISAKGWQIVTDPNQAKVILQVNVLQAGKTEANAVQTALSSGYGGILSSAGAGAAIAAAGHANGYGIGGAAVGAGLADYAGSLLVHDVLYSAITDVRVLQRGKPGEKFTVTHQTNNTATQNMMANPLVGLAAAINPNAVAQWQSQTQSAMGSNTTQSYTEQSDYKTLQTRIVSTAEKVNLEWADAAPALKKGLVQSIAGLF
jgi:hypothetical protein